jgi:hypothetical protein
LIQSDKVQKYLEAIDFAKKYDEAEQEDEIQNFLYDM